MQNVNDKMLTGAALLFVVVLILALMLQWWIAPTYKTDNHSLLLQLTQDEFIVKPWQLDLMRQQAELSKITLLLLNGAKLNQEAIFADKINVDMEQLLSDETQKLVRRSFKTFILAPDESEALAAAWLLRAKGWPQVYAIAGDPQFVQQQVLDNYHPKFAQTTAEKAKYDFARFFGNAPKPTKMGVAFAPPAGAPQVKKAAGGC